MIKSVTAPAARTAASRVAVAPRCALRPSTGPSSSVRTHATGPTGLPDNAPGVPADYNKLPPGNNYPSGVGVGSGIPRVDGNAYQAPKAATTGGSGIGGAGSSGGSSGGRGGSGGSGSSGSPSSDGDGGKAVIGLVIGAAAAFGLYQLLKNKSPEQSGPHVVKEAKDDARKAKTSAKNTATDVKTSVKDAATNVATSAANIEKKAEHKAENIVEKVEHKMSDAADKAKATGKGLVDNVKGAASNVGKKLHSLGVKSDEDSGDRKALYYTAGGVAAGTAALVAALILWDRNTGNVKGKVKDLTSRARDATDKAAKNLKDAAHKAQTPSQQPPKVQEPVKPPTAH